MASKRKVDRDKLEFPNRGRRRSPNSGLYYRSECGRYALYQSDRLCGSEVKPVGWIAFVDKNGTYYAISRHPSRKSAERACETFGKSLAR